MSKNINKNSYNIIPFLYDIRGFFILTLSYQNSLLTQIRFFSENLKGRHLECAIGTATFTMICMIYRRFLRKDKYQMVGVAYSAALLKGAKWKMRGSAIYEEDLRDMSFVDCSFDSINFANGYHTINGVDKAMKEITRVLKPGGTLFVNILLLPKDNFLQGIANWINRYGMEVGILKRPYTLEECKGFCSTYGYELIHEEVTGNAYNLKCKKPE